MKHKHVISKHCWFWDLVLAEQLFNSNIYQSLQITTNWNYKIYAILVLITLISVHYCSHYCWGIIHSDIGVLLLALISRQLWCIIFVHPKRKDKSAMLLITLLKVYCSDWLDLFTLVTSIIPMARCSSPEVDLDRDRIWTWEFIKEFFAIARSDKICHQSMP